MKKLLSFWGEMSPDERKAVLILAVSVAILIGAVVALIEYLIQIKSSGASLSEAAFFRSFAYDTAYHV